MGIRRKSEEFNGKADVGGTAPSPYHTPKKPHVLKQEMLLSPNFSNFSNFSNFPSLPPLKHLYK